MRLRRSCIGDWVSIVGELYRLTGRSSTSGEIQVVRRVTLQRAVGWLAHGVWIVSVDRAIVVCKTVSVKTLLAGRVWLGPLGPLRDRKSAVRDGQSKTPSHTQAGSRQRRPVDSPCLSRFWQGDAPQPLDDHQDHHPAGISASRSIRSHISASTRRGDPERIGGVPHLSPPR